MAKKKHIYFFTELYIILHFLSFILVQRLQCRERVVSLKHDFHIFQNNCEIDILDLAHRFFLKMRTEVEHVIPQT